MATTIVTTSQSNLNIFQIELRRITFIFSVGHLKDKPPIGWVGLLKRPNEMASHKTTAGQKGGSKVI